MNWIAMLDFLAIACSLLIAIVVHSCYRNDEMYTLEWGNIIVVLLVVAAYGYGRFMGG